jgi:deoxyadenosine kinase
MNYTQTFGSKNHIIGISGIIGVGKSTLTEKLGKELGFDIIKEPVETNEYLNSFYEDMAKYSFPMQIYLLNHRFKQHQQMVWTDKSSIQDRTIYEDVIFAKMLRESNLMSELDFKTYVDLFANMSNFLHRPDLIIYLDVDPKQALERVNQRSRGCESGLTLEYLQALKEGYEDWLNDIEGRIPVIRLDWNEFLDTKDVADMIKEKLRTKKGLII